MSKSLFMALTGAIALTSIFASTPSDARFYHRHHRGYYGYYGAFHGSACDFRNYSRDRQLQGTC